MASLPGIDSPDCR